eukprot:gene10898-7556_t
MVLSHSSHLDISTLVFSPPSPSICEVTQVIACLDRAALTLRRLLDEDREGRCSAPVSVSADLYLPPHPHVMPPPFVSANALCLCTFFCRPGSEWFLLKPTELTTKRTIIKTRRAQRGTREKA